MKRLQAMDAEHKPVTSANVIAGGQTISTHCLACGHRGELDPRVLALAVEGDTTTMGTSGAGCAATDAAHGSRGAGCRRHHGSHLTRDKAA
jgi:hypothetical protein